MNFEAAIDRLKALDLSRLSEHELRALTAKFACLPTDYIRFLREVGFGDIGALQIYSEPASVDSIFSNAQDDIRKLLIFGDDLQGYVLAFDPDRNYRVVEIDPSGEVYDAEPNFAALIEQYVP